MGTERVGTLLAFCRISKSGNCLNLNGPEDYGSDTGRGRVRRRKPNPPFPSYSSEAPGTLGLRLSCGGR